MRTREEIQALILKFLGDIAPEADLKTFQTNLPIREQIEIDSIDFLGLIAKIYKETGIDIPESDYAKLTTVEKIVDCLSERQRASINSII